MKVVGLLSGGKDSCYNLCHCAKNGHQVVCLASLGPPPGQDELDSYMYQTVGQDAVHLVAAALDLPLYRRVITGTALELGAEYGSRSGEHAAAISSSNGGQSVKGDETEDLYELLKDVKSRHPDVEAVSVGAILSNYQRVRVEQVASRLSLTVLAFLWQRDQSELLAEMIAAGMEAVFIKVAGIGLNERHLGKTLAQMHGTLESLNSRFGSHVCGEGGEYETLTLDCPLFKKRIQLEETETVIHSDSAFASVSYIRVKRASLVGKGDDSTDLVDLRTPATLDDEGARLLAKLEGQLRSTDELDRDESQGIASPVERQDVSLPPSFGKWSISRRGRWVAIGNISALSAGSSEAYGLNDEVDRVFAQLQDALSTVGLHLSHIAHINLYLSSMSHFPVVNAVYKTFFGSSPPSRACVGVGPSLTGNVRMDVFAFDDRCLNKGSRRRRRALHVQGMSYWAPANIGPYSQAVSVNERVFVAGQIGLLPSSLILPSPSTHGSADEAFAVQAALSLQHVRRILRAFRESAPGSDEQEGGLCWLSAQGVDDRRALEAARLAWTEHVGESQKLPVLFLTLPPAALPKGAGVEWQVAVHTGVKVPKAPAEGELDEEDDEGDEQCSFERCEGRVSEESASLVWNSVVSVDGDASFGTIAFRGSSSGLSGKLTDLCEKLRNAVSLRVFYSAGHQSSAIALLSVLFPASTEPSSVPAITPIPVVSIDTVQRDGAASWEVGLCWFGGEGR